MNKCILFIIIILILFLLHLCKKKRCIASDNFFPFYITENTIWTYWEQGSKNLSPFYKKCIQTWLQKNPNHNVFILDKENVYYFLNKNDLPPKWEKIKSIQLKSDFVRLALLAKYGGIWMDISTICIRPINSVFTQSKSIEGFALRRYDNKGELSVFESWFITCKKNSKVITKWKNEFLKAFGYSTSVENMDKSYFEGVDLQKIEYGWYLSIHRVMMKLNQQDPDIKDLYFNDSTIFGAEETAFIHYEYFGWDSNIKEKFMEKNDDFVNIVYSSGTPILKFTGAGGSFSSLTEEQILDNKESVLYKLIHIN